ncbi:MAG: hypothetical protein KGH56_03560 [Patescibacteria group bacterium]|nr:hypothetical protein [Patescibacteria group bacterium]
MRPLIALLFAISFGVPLLAGAQTCSNVGYPCTDAGGNAGTCVSINGVGLFCNTASSVSSGAATPVSSAPGGTTGRPPILPQGTTGGSLILPQGTTGGSNVTLINPLNSGNCTPGSSNCLMNFLNSILALVIRIGTVVVVLMLVFVGYKFVVAQGEPGKISEAREMLLWTVVGALVLLGAQAISYGIRATVAALSVGQ